MICYRFRLASFLVASIIGFSGKAAAQPIFQFVWYDSTGTNLINSINVAPSSSFSARVYITQISGSPTNYLETVGMTNFSVGLNSGTSTAPISIAATSSIVRNSQFTDSPPSGIQLGTTTTSFSGGLNDPFTPVFSPGGTNRILMGTVTFQTGVIGSQTLLASDGPLGNLGGDPFNPDVFTVNAGSLNVTVVPEPATILLVAAGSLGLCRVVIRRRKMSDAVTALAA